MFSWIRNGSIFALLMMGGGGLGSGVGAAEDGLTSTQRVRRNYRAIQTVYRQGVPHTDRQGQLLMAYAEGRSFMPIGSWGAPIHGTDGTLVDWSELKRAGFNTIWPWGWQPGHLEAQLEQAAIFDFQLIPMHPRSERELVLMRDSPHTLAHVWYDEPIGKLGSVDMDAFFKEYQDYRQLAARVAPGLQVFINDAPWITEPATSWWKRWNSEAEISCHDNYPVKFGEKITQSFGDDAQGIPESMRLAVQSNRERKPVWFIVGGFDARTPPGQPHPFRFPSAMQLRSQVYAAIIHGATGIHYFIADSYVSRNAGIVGMSHDPRAFRGGRPSEPNFQATPMQMVQSQVVWEAARAINQELQELTPILYAPTVGQEVDYKVNVQGRSISSVPIRCLLKPHPEGGYVLLTVNLDNAVLSVDYTFPESISEVHSLFENQEPQRMNPPQATFSVFYEPYEVHVYRLRQ